jgi:hypothetical protein
MLSNGRQIAYCNILHILSYCLGIEDFLGGACKKAPFFLNCMVVFAILQFFFIVVLLFFFLCNREDGHYFVVVRFLEIFEESIIINFL